MRVALLNQFFAPDISPTAQLAASLAEDRAARGDDVTVITGRAGYLEGVSAAPSPRSRAGSDERSPRVWRVWTPDLGKATALRRLVGYVAYLLGALARVVALGRQDLIVAMTTPPYTVVVALAHRMLHPRTRVVLWSMDCYPDAAERFGQLPVGGVGSRALRALNRAVFRRLDTVVSLDGAMERLLREQYGADGRPRFAVIPNWERGELFPLVATDAGGPETTAGATPPAVVSPAATTLARRLGDDGRIVVLYLGNAGVGHRFDTVLDAAERLGDDAVFAFVGGGARWAELTGEVARRGLSNVVLHGYVAKEDTPALMTVADAALITLDDRSLGVMSPSKLHATLAAGLPVLYVGPEGSNVDEAIARFGCGTSVRHGEVDRLVTAVRATAPGSEVAAAMRRHARRAFDDAYVDAVTLPAFDAVLRG